jgi:carboxyl-terminal processing protease
MAEETPMTSRTRLIVLLISAPVMAFAVVGGFLGNVMARTDDTYAHLRVFQDVVSLIMSNYVEQPDLDKVMRGAMRGLAENLDSDSAFLTAPQARQAEGNEQAGSADVGIELTHQYYLRVVAVRDDSPAAKAGIRSGDFVRIVESRPTRDMSAFEGQRLLRGAPGSKVKLTVIRGSTVEPHVVELTREAQANPASADVKSHVQGDGVGYLRVVAFGKRATDQLRTQIAALTRAGATSLIVDVRNSASGDLAEGVAAARLFVPSGTLAIRDSRAGGQEKLMAAKGDGAITMPVAVLVDSGTSGPAEIFAAALAGNKRAELIGEHTIGRAGTQELVKLPDGSGLWITTSRYLTPDAKPIQSKGLEPTVAVDQPEGEFGAPPPQVDPILQKAMERLAAKKAA